jgi:hypothetical protein
VEGVQRVLAFVALGLVLALVPAASSAAAKPPSFARWEAKWNADSDKFIGAALHPCKKNSLSDLERGECTVRRMIPALRTALADFERQVAATASGQTEPCRGAIHRYRLANRKSAEAATSYLTSHPHTQITQIAKDLNGDQYAPIEAVVDEARRHAIRVCG